MKKNNLLKVILITFLLFVVLSWFIKGSVFYQGTFYKADQSTVIGIGDIFSLPFQVFYLYAEYGIIFLIIGGFYGVLNKTGAYHKIIEKLAKPFKNRRNLAIILSAIFIMSFESIIGNSLLTFTFIPFIASFLTELNFNKKRIMLATIGSLFLGMFASITGYGELINFLLDLNKKILFKERLLIFVITSMILIVSLILKNNRDLEYEKMEFNYEESDKKSFKLILIVILFSLIAIIGIYNFEDFLGIKIFSGILEAISKISILNGINNLGSWGTKDLSALLLLETLIIAIFYRIKFSDVVESFKNGAKPMIKVSFYATLTGIIFVYYYNSNTGYNLIDTIVNSIYNSSAEYLNLKTALATPLYSVLLNNSLFLANSVTSIITSLSSNATTIKASGLALQLTSGVFGLILPTSYILIAGLAYYDISYGSWLKYIWKILVVLFLIIGIIILA